MVPPGEMGTILRRPSPESPMTWGGSTEQVRRKIGSRDMGTGVQSGLVIVSRGVQGDGEEREEGRGRGNWYEVE